MKHKYTFHKNGRYQASLICTEDHAKEYVVILRDVTYGMWVARRVGK